MNLLVDVVQTEVGMPTPSWGRYVPGIPPSTLETEPSQKLFECRFLPSTINPTNLSSQDCLLSELTAKGFTATSAAATTDWRASKEELTDQTDIFALRSTLY